VNWECGSDASNLTAESFVKSSKGQFWLSLRAADDHVSRMSFSCPLRVNLDRRLRMKLMQRC
jgi:hypothetical protein